MTLELDGHQTSRVEVESGVLEDLAGLKGGELVEQRHPGPNWTLFKELWTALAKRA
jgi:hypothetical protein